MRAMSTRTRPGGVQARRQLGGWEHTRLARGVDLDLPFAVPWAVDVGECVSPEGGGISSFSERPPCSSRFHPHALPPSQGKRSLNAPPISTT